MRVILEKFLQHTAEIDLDEKAHGTHESRQLDFEPSFIIRGLSSLQVKFTPAHDFVPNAEQTPNAAAPEKKAASCYSVDDTTIGTLLANPVTRVVLDKHFPGISSDMRIGMAKGMSLRAVSAFAPDQFSREALDAVNAELALVPVH